MGRELRMVVPNWEHPKQANGRYQPMFDKSYPHAIAEWIENHNLWERGEHPSQKEGYGKNCKHYAEYAGTSPDPEYHRPDWNPDEMTWFQVYETVSEGTPVTPPFPTKEELVEYLVSNGDFWDQSRRAQGDSIMPCDPWTREQAMAFVFGDGWVPSMVVSNGVVKDGIRTLTEELS